MQGEKKSKKKKAFGMKLDIVAAKEEGERELQK
jgi:hypothetical protein